MIKTEMSEILITDLSMSTPIEETVARVDCSKTPSQNLVAIRPVNESAEGQLPHWFVAFPRQPGATAHTN
jgi:hypothetical protein